MLSLRYNRELLVLTEIFNNINSFYKVKRWILNKILIIIMGIWIIPLFQFIK